MEVKMLENKTYEVIATYKVRHRMIVDASSPEQASDIMNETTLKVDFKNSEMDTLLSAYSIDVQEVINANL